MLDQVLTDLKVQIQPASATIFHADEAPAKVRGWKQLGCC